MGQQLALGGIGHVLIMYLWGELYLRGTFPVICA